MIKTLNELCPNAIFMILFGCLSWTSTGFVTWFFSTENLCYENRDKHKNSTLVLSHLKELIVLSASKFTSYSNIWYVYLRYLFWSSYKKFYNMTLSAISFIIKSWCKTIRISVLWQYYIKMSNIQYYDIQFQ